MTVQPNDTCNAHFAYYPLNNTDSVHFYPTGSTASSYLWHFGDGTTSTDPYPWHFYLDPGTYIPCLTIEVNGATCTWCDTVVVGGSPCDQLNAEFSTLPNGLNVDFVSGANLPDVSYQWFFGDGVSEFGQNVSHVYAANGTYHACLIVGAYNTLTQDSCFSYHCAWLTVQEGGGLLCDSLGHALFISTNSGNTVAFGNTSTHVSGTGAAYHWSFGDGTYSTLFDPAHTYALNGTYEVCLTQFVWIIGTSDTCSTTYCHVVHVSGGGTLCDSLFTVDFTWSASGTNGIFYSAQTTPFAGGWLWSFGDGQSSDSGPQGVHEYAGPGTYEFCLTAWYAIPGTSDTCTHTTCQWVTIGGGSPCDLINAGFSANTAGLTASFTNTVSGGSYTYIWHFGDGTTGYGPDPSHTYPSSGVYHACLIMWAWDALMQDTCFAEHCEYVTVEDGGILPCDSAGQASFDYTNIGTNGALFNNNSYSAPGTNTYYVWAFGDGAYSDQFAPTHLYAQSGTYEACLTQYVWIIGTTDTCSNTICHLVHVSGGGLLCDSLFTVDFTWGLTGTNSIFYSANTTPFATGWHWSYGDGQSSTGYPQGTHEYGAPGAYEFCLTAWYAIPGTSDTCTQTTCHWVTIGGGTSCDSLLEAHFSFEVDGHLVHFHDQSYTSGLSVSYAWTFGDGNNSTSQNPTHTYLQTGSYHPCLTITYINALDTCSSTWCHEVNIVIAGVEEAANSGDLAVAPQPFSDVLTLSGDRLRGIVRISLFDAVGRLVDEQTVSGSGSIVLNYGALPPATYVMHVHTDGADRALRLLKH